MVYFAIFQYYLPNFFVDLFRSLWGGSDGVVSNVQDRDKGLRKLKLW